MAPVPALPREDAKDTGPEGRSAARLQAQPSGHSALSSLASGVLLPPCSTCVT